jgi:hypothetical protein
MYTDETTFICAKLNQFGPHGIVFGSMTFWVHREYMSETNRFATHQDRTLSEAGSVDFTQMVNSHALVVIRNGETIHVIENQ